MSFFSHIWMTIDHFIPKRVSKSCWIFRKCKVHWTVPARPKKSNSILLGTAMSKQHKVFKQSDWKLKHRQKAKKFIEFDLSLIYFSLGETELSKIEGKRKPKRTVHALPVWVVFGLNFCNKNNCKVNDVLVLSWGLNLAHAVLFYSGKLCHPQNPYYFNVIDTQKYYSVLAWPRFL